MVHGRFQPFHLDHLEYALAAAARCARLVVGLTNPDPLRTRFETDDPGRAGPEANPFPYHLRERMVRAALCDAGVPPLLLSVVPFPISDPDLWPFYVPEGAVHFLRTYDAWGAAKLARLRAAGHQAVDLGGGARKGLSGSEVRRRWRARDPGWRELVPASVAALIDAASAQPPRPEAAAGEPSTAAGDLRDSVAADKAAGDDHAEDVAGALADGH